MFGGKGDKIQSLNRQFPDVWSVATESRLQVCLIDVNEG